MPGTLSLEDGRFLDRQADGQRVMVLETEGGLPPARRKRRRPKKAGPEEKASSVPVTIVTAIRSQAPFDSERDAIAWLAGVEGDPGLVDPLLDEAEALLDRALGADAAASGRPYTGPPSFRNALRCRIGIADGDRVSEGRYLRAIDIDARGGDDTRRRRTERTRPLERIAAIIGGKDEADACEYLVPRVRADLDAGRLITAALVLEVAVRSTIVETDMSLEDSDHEADLDRLESSLPALEAIRDRALTGDGAWEGLEAELEAPLAVAERVLRRRRVLTQ